MAGTITTDQTVIHAAESTTNYTSLGTWGALFAASNDIYLEGSNAINARASSGTPGTIQLAWAHTSTAAGLDLSTGNHVYFWIKCFSLPSMEKRVRGGIGISISSDTSPTLSGSGTNPWSGATNSKQWFITGNDFEPLSGWVCYVVDPTSTPDLSIGTPAMNSVDRAGIRTGALQTVGGGSVKPLPVIWDKMSYGTGLTIKDGTAGTPVTFADIYATDSTTANQYGVITKAAGIFFVAGKLNFGTVSQSAITYFKDTNQVVVFQDFPVAAGFYDIILKGAGSFATTVQLGNYSGGLASGGVVIKGTGIDTRRLIAPAIVSGGTGYTANDILTVSGGTATTAAQIKVITVSSGVITDARMEVAGVYSVPPTGTLSVTGGTGSSATFTATVAGGSIWTLTASAANQTLNLYGCTFSEMRSAALASTTTIRGSTFDNFGEITTNGATIDNCTFQNLRTTTPISATYALIVASATQMSTITNCKLINCNRAIKITASGSYTFDNITFSSNSYDIENTISDANMLIDSYDVSNQGATTNMYNGSTTGVGQSITGDGNTLGKVVFYLNKTGSPTGNAVAKVYAHSGVYGTSSVPTGTALATSSNFDVSTLTTTLSLVNFNFSNSYTLTNSTNYVLTLEYSGGDASNYITIGTDTSSPTHGGNFNTNSGSWSAVSGTDAVFYVKSGLIINALNGSDPGTYNYINSTCTFETTSCYSYNANTTTFTDETTDINDTDANDVLLPPIQATTQGDAIYFGNTATFTGVTINVGTAGVYSNITINWEYWNGSTWSSLTTVVDETNGFQTSGTNTINFSAPSDWFGTTVNSVQRFWIRARASWSASQSITTAPLCTQGWQGSTKVNNAVTLSVTVLDTSTNPIPTAQVAIYQTSDNTELMNQDTETVTAGSFVTGVTYIIVSVGTTDFTLIGASSNTVGVVFTATGAGTGTGTASNGIASISNFNYVSDTDIYIRVRKSSTGATKYIPFSTVGTITNSGFTSTVILQEDTNA